MSREKDSQIVYELVTSKYKIAERNRQAKFRFLNEMRNGSVKRRDSEPSIAQTEKTEQTRFDLSVPGTPISSRLLESLKKIKRGNNIDTDSETEDNDDNIEASSDYQTVLSEGLKKFTADMEKLHEDVSHDPLRKYFHDSDKKKTYRRDFSEVVSEFSIKKNEPETIAKVEKYFQESERMNSFKRDFTEVVQTFDPRNPTGRDQFIDLKRIGTPISSRLIAVEKLSSAIENKPVNDIINSNEIVECDINSQVQLNSNEIHCKSDDVLQHKVNECASEVKGEELKPEVEQNALLKSQEETNDETLVIKDEAAIYELMLNQHKFDNIPAKPSRKKKRTDSSSSNVSIPGTPISSRDISSKNGRNLIETDDDSGSEDEEGNINEKNDKISTFAREFVHEIENLVQKSFDDDRKETVLEELKKTGNDENGNVTATIGESEGKLNIHEGHEEGESNPGGSGNKVEDYFEKSKQENTFKRTFSEVESFNKVSKDVKEKVEEYFKESDQKRSLTRPFSQAINYVEPKIDIEQLLKPGTPISSQTVMCLKRQSQASSIEDLNELDPEAIKGNQAFKKAHDALHANSEEKENFAVNDYFKQSHDRNTYRRDFSEVMGQLNERTTTSTTTSKNPKIEKYFEQSDAQNSFQRQFSEVFQNIPPRIDDILKADDKSDTKNGAPFHYQRSSRASSVSSNGSDFSESGLPKKSKKHGKKYGIDKYFATSLYRTAYLRSNSRRQSRDDDIGESNDLKIVEDEDVFGETDLLRRQEFQHDDETRVTQASNDVNENQNVHFWRDFLKPYNLNLQTEITITKDDLLNNRTLE